MLLLNDVTGKVLQSAVEILNDASAWLVVSFILAGLLHHLVRPDRWQRALGNTRLSSIVKATLSGMLLPICSCGVIPLGLGLYYSGAYLGPTLAFMTATPIINPAAVLLAYGLLGPQIATIYLAGGFLVPVVIGLLGNALAGRELQAPGFDAGEAVQVLETDESVSFGGKIISGLHWGFMDLGVMVSKYIVIGVFLAGLILGLVPKTIIHQYLGNPGMISLAGIGILGAVMYVCAVGHIPFIAAVVAAGAAPGVAVTFLMTGAATNLPELISIYKIIGRRSTIIYSVTVVTASMALGYLTNVLLMPDFMPEFNHHQADADHRPSQYVDLIDTGNRPVCLLRHHPDALRLVLVAAPEAGSGAEGIRPLMPDRRRQALLMLLGAALLLASCSEPREGDVPEKAIDRKVGGMLLQHFEQAYPGLEVIKIARSDLNDDGRDDLIVIYRVSGDKNMMRVILDLGEGFLATNEVPAPHSNQVIQFRDIDKKPPMEFIVQGTKGAKSGFAIFRVEGNQLVDLFGEGMADCC